MANSRTTNPFPFFDGREIVRYRQLALLKWGLIIGGVRQQSMP